jgi:two-component system sensor histidine kinase MtrB
MGGLGVCLFFATTTYSIAREYLTEQRYRVVLRQAYADANFLRSRLATTGTRAADALAALSPEGATAVLVERNGRWSSSVLGAGPDIVPATVRRGAAAGQVAYAPARFEGGPALAVGIPLADVGAVVYEVASLTELQTTLRVLSTVLSAGTVAAAGLATVLGLWARRRILQPLAPLATTAAAIASGDLERRLPGTDDPDLVTMVGSFNTMVDALQQRIERDARFAADVSHELRSPLTTLVASVDLLNARAESLPARSRELLALVTAELERFQRLLESLLELARSEAGAHGPDAERIDMAALVAQVLRQSGRPVGLLHTTGEAAVVAGDRVRLERAIANLLDNADRHGGGAVRVDVERDGDAVWITVDDAGPGIPTADRERIFERFATGGGPRRSGSGAGLGLALVEETARAHAGSAWCTDSPAGGARLVFRLPEAS